MASPSDAAAARAALATGLASVSRTLDGWSRLFAALALLGLFLPVPAVPLWTPLLAGILLTGLGQLYFATRIALDRPVFALWAERWCKPVDYRDDLAAFDQALAELGWARTAPESPDLATRLSGLRRLLRRQMTFLALQAIVLAILCGLAMAT